MGLFKFLKPKGKVDMPEPKEGLQLPPLPSESDLYSELPNLPEAPETSELPEIQLPEEAFEPSVEIPAWPEPEATPQAPTPVPEVAQIPKMEFHVPQAPVVPEPEQTGAIVHNNAHFLKASDFAMVRDNCSWLVKAVQKKHSRLNDIAKEESAFYEQLGVDVEDMQRKLRHIDSTLFE